MRLALLVLCSTTPINAYEASSVEQLQSVRKLRAQQARDGGVTNAQQATWLLRSIEGLATEACGGAAKWPSARYGLPGDGGWWLCASPLLRSASTCIIYSVGIGFDMSFDLAAAALLPHCQVHALDPTPTVVDFYARTTAGLSFLPPNLHFHPWGVGREDHAAIMNNWWANRTVNTGNGRINLAKGWGASKAQKAARFLTLDTIKQRIGTPPSVLKLDVEGGEWDLAPMLPESGAEQLMLEVHHSPNAWLGLLESLIKANYTLWRCDEGRTTGTTADGTLQVLQVWYLWR